MKRVLLFGILLLAGVAAFALPVQAELIIELDFEFSSDGTPPEGLPPPWATATFFDYSDIPSLATNTVRLEMSAGGLTDAEFISEWSFNFDPVFDPILLTFAAVGTGTPDSVPTPDTGVNAFKADGDGFFDIIFNFPTKQTDNRFTVGETVVYDITYTETIDVFSFDESSSPGGGEGTYLSAAHVQGIGIGDDNSLSGWIGPEPVTPSGGVPVPEPATIVLLGVGMLGLGATAGRKMKKK